MNSSTLNIFWKMLAVNQEKCYSDEKVQDKLMLITTSKLQGFQKNTIANILLQKGKLVTKIMLNNMHQIKDPKHYYKIQYVSFFCITANIVLCCVIQQYLEALDFKTQSPTAIGWYKLYSSYCAKQITAKLMLHSIIYINVGKRQT